ALMVRPGPWPELLDEVAANASRRMWQSAYAVFKGAAQAARTGTTPTEQDVERAWDKAAFLVLPLVLDPLFADSRHAGGGYRDAVRQVAGHLLAHGPHAPSGLQLAGRLRHGLGLPARGRGGAVGVEVEDRHVIRLLVKGSETEFETAAHAKSGMPLAYGHGLKVVLDGGKYWRDPATDKLHQTKPQVAPGQPEPVGEEHYIAEFVVDPMAALPGERRMAPE
ncbi:hypothetical protein AB4212_62485, partial [Streptomyces sp. 2MCAF27]